MSTVADAVACDPRIDALRKKMQVREDPTFTQDYYAADKRHIGNAVQVFFTNAPTRRVHVDVPIGHRKRREEGTPLLVKKFHSSVEAHFTTKQAERIKTLFRDAAKLDALPVTDLMAALTAS